MLQIDSDTPEDPTKQAQEIMFSRKASQRNHPGLMFNNSIVTQAFRYDI